VARTLGPERFGVYALLFALVELLAVASGSGYADYLTREASKDPRVAWGVALQLTVLRSALVLPGVAVAIAILALLHYPRPALAGTLWLALTLIPRSLSEAVQGVLRGIRRYAACLAIELILGASLLAGAGFVLVRHGSLRMVIAAEIVAAVAASMAALVLARRYRTRETIGLRPARLIKTGAVFNLYSFIGNLYDRFDVLLLSTLAGDFATGIYAVAYRALGMTQVLAYGVLYSLLPALARNAGSVAEQRRLGRAMGFLLNSAFAIVLATTVLAGPAVRLLLGAQYADSAGALRILIWAVPLRYMNYALNTLLLAAGRERVFVVTSIVCLAVNLLGNLVLIPLYTWRAAAGMTIVTELVLLVQNLYWVRRAVGRTVLPRGMARSTLAFASLLCLALAGRSWGPPLMIGTLRLVTFVAWLYASGMWTEFAGVWSAERNSAAGNHPRR
jgi:O-antigen/teichoic acid export membrane protein